MSVHTNTISHRSNHFFTTVAFLMSTMMLTTSGCDRSSKNEGFTIKSSQERWPGGSLDAWDDEGVVASFTRRDHHESESFGGTATSGDYDTYDDYDTYGDYDSYEEAGGGEYYEEDPSIDHEPTESAELEVSGDSGDDWQIPALEGGEIDDNDDLEAYLAYYEVERALYEGDLSINHLDVTDRVIITVIDEAGVTVPDAKLTFWNEEGRTLQIGRTRADGRFAFFPHVVDANDPLEVEISSIHGSVMLNLEPNQAQLTATIQGTRSQTQDINLEVAFIIDATGSMGGEIERLKNTITSIAERVAQPRVKLRLGAVAYRDRGDEYTTQTFNFTEDIDAFQEVINGLNADGGGDSPEALNEALHEAQRRLTWTQQESLRLTFLITDASAHYYEQQEFTYAQGVIDAQQMGMKIFPIASGGSDGIAELQLRQIAQHTLAHFIFITEGGGSSSGSEGSEYHVDPAQFDVERLDNLVVRLINEELDTWRFEDISTPL